MKKIAMLNCLNANDRCTGAGCLKAFYARTGGFAAYGEEELTLTAMARCSHCRMPLEEDTGMQEKLDRLLEIGTQTVHIGVCASPRGQRCPTMESYAEWLNGHGIEVVWRTH